MVLSPAAWPAGPGTGLWSPVVAVLPAPPGNALHLGPFELRAYGLMIALGVVVAVWIAQRRWEARGHDPADIGALAVWAVPAGVVGARIYHVATDPQLFRGRWGHVFAIWEGGLGIPGGIALGVGVGVVVARRRGLPLPELFDAVAPALPVAQAIGRFGNWFNQELFGRPTSLPWALHVDPAHRPAGYARFTTFHPTFLYESLWNVALAAVLVFVVERHLHPRPGRLFVLYVGGYGLGRLWVESLRIDHANEIAGLRINEWISVLAILAALAILLHDHRTSGRAGQVEGEAGRVGAGSDS
jgi:prolipoprotein diacylglyceryl transferase